jgi:hypothetical protein
VILACISNRSSNNDDRKDENTNNSIIHSHDSLHSRDSSMRKKSSKPNYYTCRDSISR